MVVRMRSTKSKKNNRRSRQNVNIPVIKEENGVVRTMHKISRVDGSYKGKVYLDVFTKRSNKKVIKKESINKKNQSDVETKTEEQAQLKEIN